MLLHTDSIISTYISKENKFITIQSGNSTSGHCWKLKYQNLRIRQIISETFCSPEILSSDSCFPRIVMYLARLTIKCQPFKLHGLFLYIPGICICNIAHFSCHYTKNTSYMLLKGWVWPFSSSSKLSHNQYEHIEVTTA